MRITVDHIEDDRFAIDVRGHRVIVDQPVDAGGGDEGPSPTELFVSSLASCIAFYARRVLRREKDTPSAVSVVCDYEMSPEPPWRVARVDVHLVLPGGLSEARRAAVMRSVTHCTVTNTLEHRPVIRVQPEEAETRSAVA